MSLEAQVTAPRLWQAVHHAGRTPLGKLGVMQPYVTSSDLLISVVCSKYLTKTFGNCLTSQGQQFLTVGSTARNKEGGCLHQD